MSWSTPGTLQAFLNQGAPPPAAPAPAAPAPPSPIAQGAQTAQEVNPNARQLSALAPQPFQAFGNIPTVSPSLVDTSMMPGALQSFENANATALAPTFQAQDLALQDNLGGRGIINSGAATYLDQNLKGNQDAALAGANAPLIQGQQSAWNAANSQNATAGNTASSENAGFYGSAVGGNQQAYNDYLARLFSTGNQYGGGILGGYLGTYGGPNNQALGTLGQTPGAVGAAGSTAFQNAGSNPSGIASGVNAISTAFGTPAFNAEQTPNYSGGFSNTLPGSGTVGDNQASASWGSP